MPMTLRNTDLLYNDGSAQSTSVVKVRVLFDGRFATLTGGYYPGPITTIYNSFNVSSITKNNPGDYTISYASAIFGAAQDHYSIAAFCNSFSNGYGDQAGLATTFNNGVPQATSCRITTANSWNGDVFDSPRVSFTAFT
jgi:hypothetical protein